MDAEILRDMRDRTTGLQHEPHRALAQLIRILLRGAHTAETVPLPRMKSWLRGLRQTRPGSPPGCAEIGGGGRAAAPPPPPRGAGGGGGGAGGGFGPARRAPPRPAAPPPPHPPPPR